MPDQDARLDAVLEKHHDRFARSIDRCRAILSDCRSKLAEKTEGDENEAEEAAVRPPLSGED